MKAVRIHEHGDREQLRFEDAPEPSAAHGEVVVRLRACALNYRDVEGRRGWRGARVITTASTDARCRRALELGADAAINYRERSFVEEVLRLTDGRGVDLVVDSVAAPRRSGTKTT